MGNEYRTRIYSAYVDGRPRGSGLSDIAGTDSEGPYVNRPIHLHFPDDREAPILDLGCGHGALIHFARQAGYANTRGVDGSPEQVSAARRLGIEGVDEGDVVTTLAGCPTGSLGCVIAFDLMEHFTRDELAGLVDDVKQVLKPGGLWIIHTPTANRPLLLASAMGI